MNRAVEAFQEANWRFENAGHASDTTIALFYKAVALDGCGKRSEALAVLAEALEMAYSAESAQPVVAAGYHAQDFLRSIRPSEPRSRHLKPFLAQIGDFERTLRQTRRDIQTYLPKAFLARFNVQPLLDIQAFGRAEVLRDGRPVSNKEWKTSTTRELLFCLLSSDDGLTREQIVDRLWPECTLTQAHKRFKNTIYRLRSALGQETILFEDEIYRFNRGIDYRYDVERFQQYLREAASAEGHKPRAAALEAALNLYQGDYLADLDAEWLVFDRERLRRLYLEALMKAAGLYFDDCNHAAALEKCDDLLAVDPCMEDAHRLAMEIHAALGNRAAVVRQFRLCCLALEHEIDAPPSPQTEALYARLMA